jgi:hypothetical protein
VERSINEKKPRTEKSNKNAESVLQRPLKVNVEWCRKNCKILRKSTRNKFYFHSLNCFLFSFFLLSWRQHDVHVPLCRWWTFCQICLLLSWVIIVNQRLTNKYKFLVFTISETVYNILTHSYLHAGLWRCKLNFKQTEMFSRITQQENKNK